MERKNQSKRGGARPGSGRPALSEAERVAARRETVARRNANIRRKVIELTPEDVAAIEEKAAAEGKSVHAWMVGAVRRALND